MSLKQLLKSASEFHPEMMSQYEKIKQSEQDINIAKSFFDTKLNFENNYAANGFYDGSYFSTFFEQSLPWSSINLYGQFKKSNGNFPDYEGHLETLSQGEMSFGIEWSILESFITDPRKIAILEAEFKNNIEVQQAQLVKIFFQEKAAQAFFKWKAYVKIFNTYQNLLALAQNRQEGLIKRNKFGDLATIYIEENQRYIFERERKVLLAKQLLDNAIIELLFFLRNSEGNIQYTPDTFKLEPDEIDEGALSFEDTDSSAINNFPGLSIFLFRKKIIDQTMQYLKIKRLPDLKIKTKYSKDLGTGSQSLAPQEFDISSNFSFPLQNRKNKATYLKAKSKLRELNFSYQAEKEKLNNAYKQILVSKNTAQKQLKVIQQEVTIAKKLAQAERIRWENGDSNFLLVNLREQDLAATNIELIKTHLALETLWVQNLGITNNFEKLLH
ncbi:MAG TPA: TolC family protein [Oligoflexia bacterium]|nr:TolC family protein [Oligoflexia bacterium]